MLVRILNMRGVNLNVFDFDYDLTWAGFFMNGHEKVYGRFGGRDAGDAEARLTLAGLKHAMRAALAAHQREPDSRPTQPAVAPRTAESYPAAARLKAGACIHCHQVYDFQRAALREAGQWTLDRVWVYPQPENVGITLDVNAGNNVTAVRAGSPAAKAGLRTGDTLTSVNGQPVASQADVQHALHRAPEKGDVPFTYTRAKRDFSSLFVLETGWRKSDISWRSSMWGLEPPAGVHGTDLTIAEKSALNIAADRLAFRQGKFVTAQARKAGIQEGDVIIGIDNKQPPMNMLQFNAYVRLNHKVGDTITYNVLRDGKRLDLPMLLPARTTF